MIDNINQVLQESTQKIKDMATSAGEKITDLKDSGVEKVTEYLNELSSGLPLIEEAGFTVDGVSVDLAIPPDISISFTKNNEVPPALIEKLIEENKDKTMLVMILKALLAATNIQSKVTLNKFIFGGVAIKLGIPPSVSLKYK